MVSQCWRPESKIRVSAAWAPSAAVGSGSCLSLAARLLSACRWLSSPVSLPSLHVLSNLLFYKDVSHTELGATLTASLYLGHVWKDP